MIQWKQIEEAPDYWISNRGEILSKRIEGKERMIVLHNNKKTGYKQVTLILSERGDKKRIKKTYYPHQLVAQYFVENPNGYNRINHKDLDKHNNHYWNLEWVSQEQNIHHYYNSNALNKPRNMKKVEVWSIGGDYINTYDSVNQAAKAMGVCPSSVHNQCKVGGATKPRTFVFKYKD